MRSNQIGFEGYFSLDVSRACLDHVLFLFLMNMFLISKRLKWKSKSLKCLNQVCKGNLHKPPKKQTTERKNLNPLQDNIPIPAVPTVLTISMTERSNKQRIDFCCESLSNLWVLHTSRHANQLSMVQEMSMIFRRKVNYHGVWLCFQS